MLVRRLDGLGVPQARVRGALLCALRPPVRRRCGAGPLRCVRPDEGEAMIMLLIVLAVIADLADFEVHGLAFFGMAVFLIGCDRIASATRGRL